MVGLRSRNGFAMVIIMVAVSAIASILIGYALIGNAAKNSIYNAFSDPVLVAKQNAIRGLTEALGKLQSATGFDQVATANAQIIDGYNADKKYWVGAWQVEKCNESNPGATDQKRFIAWLVSGNYLSESDVKSGLGDKISILGSAHNSVDKVYVSPVAVTDTNQKTGHYAYWVDDESLKIQGNIYAKEYFKFLFNDGGQGSSYTWFTKRQCQFKYGISMVDNNNCAWDQTFLGNHPDVVGEPSYRRYMDRDSSHGTDMTEGQDKYLRSYFHDFTHGSFGLLTDARNGGFRKNLKYDAKIANNYLGDIPNNAFMFEPMTEFPAPPPTWGYFKSFINIGSGTLTARVTTPLYCPQTGVNYSNCKLTTSQSGDWTTGTISGDNSSDLGIATQYGIYPIWVDFKHYIKSFYCNQYGKPGWYSEELGFLPGYVFDNPYFYSIYGSNIKTWFGSPYVQDNYLEQKTTNQQKERYQKYPTVQIKFYQDSTAMGDCLFQKNAYAGFTETNMFPFGSNKLQKYMRPIIDGKISGFTFPSASSKRFMTNAHGEYTDTYNNVTLSNTSEKYIINYHTRNCRIYQNESYKSTLASKVITNSLPSGDSIWSSNGITMDPWDPIYLRTADNNGNIFQQIVDIPINYIKSQRNCTITDPVNKVLSGSYSAFPLWIISVEPNISSSNYSSTSGLRPFVESNYRAPIICRTARQDDMSSSSYSNNLIPGNSFWNAKWRGIVNPATSDVTTSLGNDDLLYFTDKNDFHYLFDMPLSNAAGYKFLNIAWLQHFNVGNFSYHPSYAIGNSYQNPWILRDRCFQENPSITGSVWPSHNRVELLYDYSYALNRVLFDSFFVASTSYSGGESLCFFNPRQRAFTWSTESEICSFRDSAQAIAIHGAFNVNSTSSAAWTAFLGSTIGNITGNTNNAEYSRIQAVNTTSNIGVVKLDSDKVRSLATNVVSQIKKRGVAGSIGEFINRKLIAKSSDTDGLGIKGALQTAIDMTDINDTIGGTNVTSKRNKDWFDDDAASGPFYACKPGYLTQADILQSTSTVLCARGDTFTIHMYGDATDSSGNILATIRGEALVQRMPYDLDSIDTSLGRAYEIIAITWDEPEYEMYSGGQTQSLAQMLGISNPQTKNNIGSVIANVAWANYGALSAEWAYTKFAESTGIANYKFQQKLSTDDTSDAIDEFLSATQGIYSAENHFKTLSNDATMGKLYSLTLSSIESTRNLLSGGGGGTLLPSKISGIQSPPL